MKLFGASVLGMLALAMAGCGEDSPGPTRSPYPRDNELRMNQVQLKGTHNSYHIAQDPAPVPELDYTFAPLDMQLEEQGVRKFELDTNYIQASETIEVFHILIVDEGTHCRLFVDCLRSIEKWSSEHPGHVPIFIQIEPKGQFPSWLGEAFFEQFEGEILKAFPRERIITPDDVQGEAPTLREGVTTNGWPTLARARGKVLFFINDRADFARAYSRDFTTTAGRLMFAESQPGEDIEAVRILNGALSDFSEIQQAVKDGFIVRTRDGGLDAAQDPAEFESALKSGAQIISTDFPVKVDGVDYVMEIPGGTPARCNPLNAPTDCTSADIESRERLR